MGRPALSSVPSLLALHGELLVVGFEPDGDTMRFAPRSPELLRELRDADRIPNPERVSLRFEGIDAPETHYRAPEGGASTSQPLGGQARDALLAAAGFTHVERRGEQVTAATPATRPAIVLADHCDVYGRVVASVLPGEGLASHEPPPEDGTWAPVDRARLEATLNASQLRSGAAFLTLYTSQPPAHRRILRGLSRAAREARLGVHAADRTAAFTLHDLASLGPGGQLVLPKLFRRCVEYLGTRTRGETLPAWLAARATGKHPADDPVVVGGHRRVALHELVEQDGEQVRLTADPLQLVFVDALSGAGPVPPSPGSGAR